jgi:hypothetical protein
LKGVRLQERERQVGTVLIGERKCWRVQKELEGVLKSAGDEWVLILPRGASWRSAGGGRSCRKAWRGSSSLGCWRW